MSGPIQMLVQIPVMVTKLYGKYRNPLINETGLQPLVTMVHAVRKHEMSNGVYDDKMVDVDAFIPIDLRGMIDAHPRKWVTPEILRTVARIKENKNSLREFMDSDEVERKFEQPAE